MVLYNDDKHVEVMTLYESIFPKGTRGDLIDCVFVGKTTERIYLFRTNEHVRGLVDGVKVAWYLDRGLVNVIDG